MALLPRNYGAMICNGPFNGGTGLDLREAKSNVVDFCTSVAQANVGIDANQTATYKTSRGDSDMSVSITYSSTCEADAVYTIDINTCEQTFYRILEECDSHVKGNLGHFGGNVTNDCGVYDISTEIKEIVRCGGNPYNDPMDLYTSAIDDAIYEYCNKSLMLSSSFENNDKFFQSVPPGKSYHNYVSSSLLVRIMTQFSDQGQEDCAVTADFNTKGEECRRKLSALRDQCGVQGGGLSENGKNGCVLWTMWGQHLR
ncbi:uncharacterized protein CLAFUR5_11104 [Fulvia fulva]|uniref:Uncharacterized protein n=1 Tax=Passalora fulva TaxID=5499 RepID=A0A9Q8PDY2_PASFU|nr:uncharacterized protein CLAFUR5_11104 [Fulvia fulva]KAK4618501.1 hypothetical protein CLAFUR0_12081 [Fulvia fulva]UJO20657.1 hypothetical protein CLAFUR5_11104 [Fulvia fulva]WPV32996.1 hypothetical protein CLAFUW7_12072 [Fulvia fulva]